MAKIDDAYPLLLRDEVQFVMRPDLMLTRCGNCASYLNWRHMVDGNFPELMANCCVKIYCATTITPSLAMFEVKVTPLTSRGDNVRSISGIRKVSAQTPNESPPGKKT